MRTILVAPVALVALVAALLLASPALGAHDDGINFDKPTKDWYKGPVRYLITKQERKAYKALEEEIERATFIDWFWQRRDVIPETSQNEFRDRFERRVLESTRKFSFTTTPGWKTDMGKIYVLVGPPDEINSDLVAKSHRGIVTWVYRRPPFPDLLPNTVIGFARDASGEFRLSASPTLDSDVARGLQFANVKRTIDDQIMLPGRDPALLAAGVSVGQSELETRIIYGRMMQLPPHEEEMFQSLVMTRESYAAIPVETRVDFYKGRDDTTYSTITIGIRSSSVQYRSKGGREVPDVGVFGKVISLDREGEEYPLASDSTFTESRENAEAGPADLLLFQATGGFKPGRYEIVLGVEDRVTRKIAAFRKKIFVPDLSGEGLTLSSVTLAATMEPTDYAPTTAKPFYLGKFQVVPRPDNIFRKSEELNIYFQIYNPAPDPQSGRPLLDVLYTFRGRSAEGTMEKFGTYAVQDSRAQVQGYAVALDKWPAGAYQVTVTVRDKVAGVSKDSPPIDFVIGD